MILSGACTILNLGPLNDMVSVDVRMSFNRLQSKAVRFPCNKVV
jgi:hypothetical protein